MEWAVGGMALGCRKARCKWPQNLSAIEVGCQRPWGVPAPCHPLGSVEEKG